MNHKFVKQTLQLFFISLLLNGCAGLEKGGFLTPPAAQSEYFHTTAAGFSLTTGDPDSMKYFISLDVINQREKNIYIEAWFEDPLSPKSPIIIRYTLQPEESAFTLTSPPVYGLRSYEGYVIDIYTYEDSTKSKLLGKHRQVVQSIIDQNKIDKIWKQKE